jgi:DNA-directed RNA polymerase subunit RPC12/RpoP
MGKNNENFINEQCSICGKEFKSVSQIRVDVDRDRYVCKRCSRENHLHTTECMDYSDGEI